MSDWISLTPEIVERVILAHEARRRRQAAAAEAEAEPRPPEPAAAAAGGDSSARVVRVSDVEREPVRWLWRPWLPAGKLIVIDGDPGRGKSVLTLDVAARITTGSPMPDGSPGCEPGRALILSAEDGLRDTIRPRLEAHGAALDRVFVLAGVADRRGERPPSLPADVPLVERIVREHDVRLVVVDPLSAFFGAEVDSHVDASVRRCLHALSRLAEETGAAILCVRHLRKGGAARAVLAGGGSIGIIGAARVGWLAAADPADPERRILAVSKSNLGPIPSSLAYRLVADERHDVARIRWEGATDHRADDLVAAGSGRSEERDAETEAVEFLRAALADGPRPARDLLREARSCGIPEITLRRAKAALGVSARKTAFGGGWEWSLDAAREDDQGDDHLRRCSTDDHLRENRVVERKTGALTAPEPPKMIKERDMIIFGAEGGRRAEPAADAERCPVCDGTSFGPLSGACRTCGTKPWEVPDLLGDEGGAS